MGLRDAQVISPDDGGNGDGGGIAAGLPGAKKGVFGFLVLTGEVSAGDDGFEGGLPIAEGAGLGRVGECVLRT